MHTEHVTADSVTCNEDLHWFSSAHGNLKALRLILLEKEKR